MKEADGFNATAHVECVFISVSKPNCLVRLRSPWWCRRLLWWERWRATAPCRWRGRWRCTGRLGWRPTPGRCCAPTLRTLRTCRPRWSARTGTLTPWTVTETTGAEMSRAQVRVLSHPQNCISSFPFVVLLYIIQFHINHFYPVATVDRNL